MQRMLVIGLVLSITTGAIGQSVPDDREIASNGQLPAIVHADQLAEIRALNTEPNVQVSLGSPDVTQAGCAEPTCEAITVCDPIDVVTCTPVCDLTPSAWLVELEYLNWQPHQRGLDFAVAENGDAITVGTGQIHNLELDRDNGFRTGIHYQTKTGWSFGGRYTYFDSDGTATIERPPGVGELFATRSHPDTNEEAEIATATGAIDYRVFELNVGRSIFQNRFSNIRLFGGLRYSELSQRLRLDYDGRDFVNGIVSTSTDIDGFGMQFGAQGHWRMANGFGLFGRVTTGLTFGDFDTHLFESNLDGAQLITDVHDHFNQSVPVIELRTGVSWQCRGFELAAGYEFTNWFNVGNRSQLIDDIHEGLYGPFGSDIFLEGLFGRASYQF